MPSQRETDPLFRWKLIGFIALALTAVSVPLHAIKEKRSRDRLVPSEETAWTFVGRESCIDCHEEASEAWRGSHHDLSTTAASDSTVLARFGGTEFRRGDLYARFFTRDGGYFVSRRDGDGEPTEYRIAYTLGAEPLQTYLVPFPDGRFQVLDIAWDTEAKRWFYLNGDEDIDPDDPGHWTRDGSTWNSACAECHSTALTKGYDFPTRSFSTTWSEIDVSCEACHGPGSRHAEWAEVPPMARLSTDNYELLIRTSDIEAADEVELCAPCHARRFELGDYDHRRNIPLHDLVPALLTDGLYHPDGQILDQVYVYGSYKQSKMYQVGVRCSSCHDVHSLELIEEGNALCLRCHRASTYDDYDHHFHKKVHEGKPSDGALCVSCHMPESPYMAVDYRADHGMLIPRPDLTLAIGVPNACSAAGCHDDKPVSWSADHFIQWYGEAARPHYGSAFAAAREGRPEAEADLALIAGDSLQPAVVRATALALLRPYRGDAARSAFEQAVEADDPLVRYTAASNLHAPTARELARALAPLLLDPIRGVRLAAAIRMAETPAGSLQPYQREALDAALREFEAAMEYALPNAIAAFNLGNLAATRRDSAAAETYYRAANEADASFQPARLNLARLLFSRGDHDEAEALYREVLRAEPTNHEAAYRLGLLLAERGPHAEAATHLRRAAEARPEAARIHFDLGRIELSAGREAEAEAALRKALEIEPDNLDYGYALASLYVSRGDYGRALDIADRLIAAHPDDETGWQVKMYIESLLQHSN